jgi:nicotinate-nucleotide adenylyltransferase
MRRVGIYPGTFDPIHEGHIAFAQNALTMLGLDTVFFVPEAHPRSKQGITDLRHRLTMAHQVAKSRPQLQALRLASKCFTVRETLPELQRLLPGDRLTFLVGSDVAKHLGCWEDLDLLLPNVEFAVGLRGSDTAADITALFDALPQSASYTVVPADQAHAASSVIRQGDHSAAPAEVRDYITQYQLYAK